MGGLIVLAITFGLMWVLFILPQQRRVKAQQALVASLEVGQEVMTSSGIFGTITAIDDDVVRVQVAPALELRMARGAIAKRVDAGPAELDTPRELPEGESSGPPD